MKAYLIDLADRVFWTYVQALGGLAIATNFDWFSLSGWKVAIVASVPAAVAVVKGAVAKFVNDPNTATFIKTRRRRAAGTELRQ